ncbi:MAG: glycosyltransferase [Solirubrobacteraceae bacterium]
MTAPFASIPAARRRRLLLAAFGDPGHAFPILALGRGLVARGHDVWIQTWERWRADVEASGMRFSPAPEYPAFWQPGGAPLDPYAAVRRAAVDTVPLVREVRPHAVVHDVLTLAPALAAEACGVPVATLIPHLDPRVEPGWAPFASGMRPPRTPIGRAFVGGISGLTARALDRGRRDLNAARAVLDLPPVEHDHGGLSRSLTLVASVPHLEYPRERPLPGTHLVGPLVWEPPAEPVEPPPGDDPLVLVAPSTSQDPDGTLLRAALRGLADAPVRVLAATNRTTAEATARIGPLDPPDNARVVPWVSYGQTMPLADVVVGHAGHGTLLRALAAGRPMVAIPAAGDMYENAARVAWAGVGVRLPRRLAGPRVVRAAVMRLLEDPEPRRRAAEIATWIAAGDAVERAAPLIEALAARAEPDSRTIPPVVPG